MPESEQPYKVPGNWCWTYLTKGAAECLDSFRKPINATERANREGDIPYYGATGQVGWIDDFLTNEQLVLVGEDGAPFLDFIKDKAYIIEGKAWVNNHAHILRSRFGTVGNLFLMHYLNVFNYNDFVNGTTRLKLTQGSMDTMPVPIPPVPEQQRIVDRIESLFAKLDEAKQKVQDVLDSVDPRKASILHKAFIGELTAQWRKEYGVGMESWKKANLGEYVDSQYGYTESASQEQVGPKFLRITDIQDGIVNWGDVPFCKISDTDFERYAVSKNDIVIARTGATTGKSYLIVDDLKAVFASYLIRIKIKSPELQPQYLYAFMQSQMYWGQITEFSAGIAQPGVNAKKLKEIMLPIPSVPEQVEIVRILDSLLAKEQQAKEAAEGVLEQINLIKKTVLARAFRGELGTNDPSEESAIKLLEQIFSETIESKKERHKQGARQKAEVIFVSKTIMEALSTGARLTPENLKRETALSIDDFYAQLKGLIDNGSVIESRENGESYLEAANEDRQAKNQ